MTKIVFMGSPDFSLPSLRALAQNYEVVGVVTQPDRVAGRGRELKSPPVKTLALDLGIPVMQPEKLRAPEAMQQLRAWAPDLIVLVAFGQILKKHVFLGLDFDYFTTNPNKTQTNFLNHKSGRPSPSVQDYHCPYW